MEQFFSIPSTMIWPLLACLVLTGILAYFGVHIIAREVIFVDLALAQIAALGTIIGVLLGYEVGKDETTLYLYSLAFTFLGAFIFSMTKSSDKKVPHEAIIGIVYAAAFAATMLVLARSALGPQELDRIIKGELLWVQPNIILKTAILYAAIGAFHIIYRNRFIQISFKHTQSNSSGLNVRLWDFLFYVSFGFVITSSVAIAGVFLVFSYLVIPAVGAMLFSDRLGVRLAIGWISGSIISFIGIKLSWETGLPTSPLIVCMLASALILAGVVRYVKTSPSRARAFGNIALTSALLAVFTVGLFFFGKKQESPYDHALHMLESAIPTDRVVALTGLEGFPERKDEWIPLVIQRLGDSDQEVRKSAIDALLRSKVRSAVPQILPLINDPSSETQVKAIEALRTLGDRNAALELIDVGNKEEDIEIKVELYGAALSLGDPDAIPPLIGLVAERGIFSEEALEQLQAHVGFNLQKLDDAKLKVWWEKNKNRMVWEDSAKMFRPRP